MAVQNQPLTLELDGTGAQTITNPNGTPLVAGDDRTKAVIRQSQTGPAVPINPDGTPLNLTVQVATPYSLTMPPGAIVVG